MMKKKILSLCMVAIMLNISVESYAYSLNNIQLATNSDSTSTPSEGGGPSSGGGEAEQPPSAPPDGSNSGDSAQPPSSSGGSTGAGGAGGSTTAPNTPLPNKGGSNSVELDGGIGEWGPDKDKNLPNFNGTEGSEKPDVDNALQEGQYFTISATVPLGMEFLIKNKDKHGFSTEGIFISPYYKVINNGSHTLKVHFESFEYATSSSNKTSGLIQEELEKVTILIDEDPMKNVEQINSIWKNIWKVIENNEIIGQKLRHAIYQVKFRSSMLPLYNILTHTIEFRKENLQLQEKYDNMHNKIDNILNQAKKELSADEYDLLKMSYEQAKNFAMYKDVMGAVDGKLIPFWFGIHDEIREILRKSNSSMPIRSVGQAGMFYYLVWYLPTDLKAIVMTPDFTDFSLEDL